MLYVKVTGIRNTLRFIEVKITVVHCAVIVYRLEQARGKKLVRYHKLRHPSDSAPLEELRHFGDFSKDVNQRHLDPQFRRVLRFLKVKTLILIRRFASGSLGR